MAENKMAEVAKLLELELEEEFKMRRADTKAEFVSKYKLTENDGLQEYDKTWGWKKSVGMLALVTGRLEVVKLPYKPQKGEKYWTYNIDGFCVVDVVWSDWAQEFALLKCGAVFRTKAEAIEARPRIYKELTGKEWTQ